jgi:DNA-binding transcriptional LysR family regulator
MSAGFQPRVVQEATHIMTIIGLVRAGLGIALLPQSASQVQMPGVRYLPMRYDGPRAETVLGRRAGPENPLVRAFLGAAISQRPVRRSSVTPPAAIPAD